MTRPIPRLLGYAAAGAGVAAAGYVGLVTGACPIDLGIGRRVRPLGPQLVDMAAPREVVFDVIAEPYRGRTPRALADRLRVLERGSDMVLAAHFTPLGGAWAWSPRRSRRSASPGPSGSTSASSADRSRTSWRRSSSPSRPVAPARGWPTTARSAPTSGGRGSGGPRWSRSTGSRPSRPPWRRSRPRPNGERHTAARPPGRPGSPLPTLYASSSQLTASGDARSDGAAPVARGVVSGAPLAAPHRPLTPGSQAPSWVHPAEHQPPTGWPWPGRAGPEDRAPHPRAGQSPFTPRARRRDR
jgi:hypothetical protein